MLYWKYIPKYFNIMFIIFYKLYLLFLNQTILRCVQAKAIEYYPKAFLLNMYKETEAYMICYSF